MIWVYIESVFLFVQQSNCPQKIITFNNKSQISKVCGPIHILSVYLMWNIEALNNKKALQNDY